MRLSPFPNTEGHFFRGVGQKFTVTKNTTSDLDFAVAEARKFDGLQIMLTNHDPDDTMTLQVVDEDGVYYAAGTVLDEFATDWQVCGSAENQGHFTAGYPALLNAGLYLRIEYTSVGTVNDVICRVNYFLHQVP